MLPVPPRGKRLSQKEKTSSRRMPFQKDGIEYAMRLNPRMTESVRLPFLHAEYAPNIMPRDVETIIAIVNRMIVCGSLDIIMLITGSFFQNDIPKLPETVSLI